MRLLILACSATKSGEAGRVPAFLRYQGPLWQTLRACDPEGTKATTCFLSGRYGFGAARWTALPPYDTRMSKQLAEQMAREGVLGTWPKFKPGTMPGCHAAAELASITHYGDRPVTEVCLVGGHLYLEVMRAFVKGFQDSKLLRRDVKVVEINGGIGEMRHELRAWLEQLTPRELEYRAYAKEYGVSLEKAKLDVDGEHSEQPTQVDAFYERQEVCHVR